MDLGAALDRIIDEFSGLKEFVTEGFYSLGHSLQVEIAETITGLVENAMRPTLLHYIEKPVHLRDGTTVQGQSSFDRLVREDKDIFALIERYRPSYLFYLKKARKVKQYINWDSDRFATDLAGFLRENDIDVDAQGYAYLARTCDRFRRKIYG